MLLLKHIQCWLNPPCVFMVWQSLPEMEEDILECSRSSSRLVSSCSELLHNSVLHSSKLKLIEMHYNSPWGEKKKTTLGHYVVVTVSLVKEVRIYKSNCHYFLCLRALSPLSLLRKCSLKNNIESLSAAELIRTCFLYRFSFPECLLI